MAIMEIFLQPGDWYFGDKQTRIRTLLGSCIAITIWHPRLLVGGMCHFLLPERGNCAATPGLDGKYGDEAVAVLLQEVRKQRTQPGEYVCKIFGGGNMLQSLAARHSLREQRFSSGSVSECSDVPCKNVRAARSLVSQAGFRVAASHLGGHGHRNLYFEIWSGDVFLKFTGHGADVTAADVQTGHA
ncbi:chemotaxis protein CheD [Acidithiobacillus montserratensis]|uniref:Chemotaxis protein CheD n=1 Tax=Acidithiobacillus montserratensis TaxID=2729135 RepID=A0ACD5HLM8_9PROT|nr:chemotaxis protein CheD [Acidithiobacillus montserratensis]MBN2679185.1 chemotaxis protein CheD [Acidithiobacillaceae bacterium]MBU2747746.1 chemotaxis protein CheD [Acidithiobacillus montserratensis]